MRHSKTTVASPGIAATGEKKDPLISRLHIQKGTSDEQMQQNIVMLLFETRGSRVSRTWMKECFVTLMKSQFYTNVS